MDPAFLGPLVPIAAIIAFAAVKIARLRASSPRHQHRRTSPRGSRHWSIMSSYSNRSSQRPRNGSISQSVYSPRRGTSAGLKAEDTATDPVSQHERHRPSLHRWRSSSSVVVALMPPAEPRPPPAERSQPAPPSGSVFSPRDGSIVLLTLRHAANTSGVPLNRTQLKPSSTFTPWTASSAIRRSSSLALTSVARASAPLTIAASNCSRDCRSSVSTQPSLPQSRRRGYSQGTAYSRKATWRRSASSGLPSSARPWHWVSSTRVRGTDRQSNSRQARLVHRILGIPAGTFEAVGGWGELLVLAVHGMARKRP